MSAVAIGAISGSLILSASVVYGLGVLAILAPLQIAVTVMFIGLCLVIYYLYQHWEEIKLEDVSQTFGDVSQTLGLHKEGLIGAPINAIILNRLSWTLEFWFLWLNKNQHAELS